MKLLVEL